jgi:hypothetical protein
MCVDYTSLNMACPKGPFPFPQIDQVVDLTTGCELLSFLDAYSSYHQICRGNLPRTLRAASYGPKLLNVIGSLKWHTAEEPYTSYQEATIPLAG